jgi:hypothetical protein
MNNEFAPRKAEKKRVKLKMAVQGPSGSGKTWGALALARNLWPEAKICVVDTENESASLYADRFAFDTIPLSPPFGTDRYVHCIDAVVRAGYDVLIIDTITAQWDGSGGILQRKNEMDMRGGNSFTNWSSFTPEHEGFKQAMLQAPIHVIATMRSKQDYILQANDKGKQMPKKVGLSPIQRDQIDYEFTLVFDVQMDHKAVSSKDRTHLFLDSVVDLADPKTADAIRGWLESGVEAHQNSSAAPSAPPPVQPVTQPPAAPQTASQSRVGPTKRIPPTPPENVPGLLCTVKRIKESPKKGNVNANISVVLDEVLNGSNQGVAWVCSYATCWHASLFDALRKSVGKECQFHIKERDAKLNNSDEWPTHFIDIEDVAFITDPATGEFQEYVAGKPVIQAQQ